MKRTGRRLTLSNDINTNLPTDSIFSSDYRLTTIFQDDRENYGWKIVDIKNLPPISVLHRNVSWALMSVRPDSFESLTAFQLWASAQQPYDNSLIGTFFPSSDPYSLRTEHVATNHLALFYNQGDIPYYNITLEEYQISSSEEIMFKIKETSQSLSDIR